MLEGGFLNGEKVEKVVREIVMENKMVSKKIRGKTMKDMAKVVVTNWGLSFYDLNALLRELSLHQGWEGLARHGDLGDKDKKQG